MNRQTRRKLARENKRKTDQSSVPIGEVKNSSISFNILSGDNSSISNMILSNSSISEINFSANESHIARGEMINGELKKISDVPDNPIQIEDFKLRNSTLENIKTH
ncbi:MAG: hypothetical protein K2Q22_13140 [Cytophagales bacterium]|nr:hypothetical protein [Cytophagales bacterium]